jgi:ribosomal protein L35
MKTNKSYSKRVKVTKNGKVVARKTKQNHFNSKDSGTSHLKRKRTQNLTLTNKTKARFLKK